MEAYNQQSIKLLSAKNSHFKLESYHTHNHFEAVCMRYHLTSHITLRKCGLD